MKIKNTELTILKSQLPRLKTEAVIVDVHTGFKKGLNRPGDAAAAKDSRYKAKNVIYAALAKKTGQTDEAAIRLACRNIFLLSGKLKLKSVALPALGYNEGRFPLVGSAKIMTQEVLKYLREHPTSLKQIIFCVPDEKSFRLLNKTVRGYVEHILYKFSEGPFVTVDAIIELSANSLGKKNWRDLVKTYGFDGKSGIILIERSNPPYGLALPGGFVDYGESLEEAVCREAKEETNMTLTDLRQFHTYSKPDRDPRFHTIGTVFVAKGKGKPKFGDDAKGLRIVPYRDLLKINYAFDHKNVIRNYLKARKNGRLSNRF